MNLIQIGFQEMPEAHGIGVDMTLYPPIMKCPYFFRLFG